VSVATPILIYSLSAGADLGSTEYALSRGGREINPLMQTREMRIGRAVLGVGIATGLDVYLQKRAPKWVWIPRVVIPAVSVGIAVHNMRTVR